MIKNIKKLYEIGDYKTALTFLIKYAPDERTSEINGLIGACLFKTNKLIHAKNYLINSILEKYDSEFANYLEQIFLKLKDEEGLLGLKLIKLEQKPKDIYLLREITTLAKKIKKFDVAIENYELLIKLCPDDYVALNNLGLIYEELGEWEKAYELYKKSLKLKDFFSPNFNLGIMSKKMGKYADSVKYLKKAISQNPTSPQPKYSLAMAYLAMKNFKDGYPLYANHMTILMPSFYKNEWDGKPHKDKSLCVFTTGGLGDIIMFSRYLDYLDGMFKEVYIILPEALRSIFQLNYPKFKIIKPDWYFTNYDYAITPMHLLKIFNLDFTKFVPKTEGFLKVEEELVEKYKEKFFNHDKLKIAINWHGNREGTRTFFNRSMPLEFLKPIFEKFKDKAIFYSVQKDDSHNECVPFGVVDLYDEIADFKDTAAILKNVDFLITIDSSPLHMAGALGLKTFCLLPFANEWRWFTEGDKTIWYDSVELVRQEKEGDWKSAVDKLSLKLNQYL